MSMGSDIHKERGRVEALKISKMGVKRAEVPHHGHVWECIDYFGGKIALLFTPWLVLSKFMPGHYWILNFAAHISSTKAIVVS